jgi:hypothetical protein
MTDCTPIIFPPRAQRLAAYAQGSPVAAPLPQASVPAAAGDTRDQFPGRNVLSSPDGIEVEALPVGDTPPALPGTGAGGAIAAALEQRLAHVASGHTPASDAAQRADHLPIMARRYAEQAIAFARNDRIDTDHRMQRHKLAACAAFALAAIDRLDWIDQHEGTDR